MRTQLSPGRRRTVLAVATVASLAVAGLAAGTSYASGSGGAEAHRSTSARATTGRPANDPYIDVTDQGGKVLSKALRAKARATGSSAVAKSNGTPGADGQVLDLGSTGTVRFLGNLNGFLTPRSSKSPKSIALGFVRANHEELGLALSDLSSLHLHRNYVDITGTHHLYFTQKTQGHTLARNGLTAAVNKAGHLLTLGGTPVSLAARNQLPAASTHTITTAAQALAKTRGPELAGADLSADTARQVVLETADGLRPAWETVVTSSTTPATTVIDAVTGQVLLRTPLKQYEHSTGRVYKFYPGARKGGKQVKVDFTKHHWLGKHAHVLKGNNSHTFSDVNDNNRPSKSEEVHAKRGQSWAYKLMPFHLGFAKKFCGKIGPCSWNPNKAFSWRKNRAQNATQVFFFVNNWHDHLKKAPIGFTEAAGNFQLKNHTKQGKGKDPVATQTDDGANTGTGRLKGLPDGNHIDNANMATPPDGHKPTMQMFLQHFPGTAYSNSGDPFSPTNVGDEADTVYHEYTHGLSNRLNVDVQGRSTLGGGQAGAMGEAWSDWYAMDYLNDQHLQKDKKGKADVRLFVYDGKGVNFDRTEPLDCKVGQQAKLCHDQFNPALPAGGYTYADYGQICCGGPEVHADGEIWAQTLWDLRDKIGSKRSESIVTRAMELAPYNPSYIDMRNAILVADNSVFGGRHHDTIWKVFAKRGMGFSAGSMGGNDTSPTAAFDLPPAPAKVARGTISGTVVDPSSHQGVGGATVTLVFGGAGVVNPTVRTAADGSYRLTGVPVGRYGRLFVDAQGVQQDKSVTVTRSGATVDFAPSVG